MVSIILISLFLMTMVAIGIWGMKKTNSVSDFFLGGRTVGPWVSAFAYGTTYFSAVLFIGFAGKIGWGFGFNALWIAVGNACIGSLLAWLVLGKRTRTMTQNLNVMTMPEFLQERFQGKWIKLCASLIIFIFLLPYSASVFKGLGHLFEAAFHIRYEYALLVMIAITGIYLVLGGYFAITLTDFIQGIIMFVGAFALIAVFTSKGGGVSEVIHAVNQQYPLHVPVEKQPSLWLLASLVFMTSFGVWGMPQMVQKFYAIKSETVIPKAACATFVFACVITFTAYYVGALSHIFLEKLPMVNGKPAFDLIVPTMLIQHLPEMLMALILLLVLSASMSTLSSLVLVSASAITIDVYQGYIKKDVSKERSLLLMRILSGVFVLISYIIAKYEIALIVTLMSLSWGVIAGAFFAPYVYALFWKRTTRLGVISGMAAGVITSITLFFVWGPQNSPMASSVAMIIPFFIIPLVSMVTKPPHAAVLNKAFQKIA